MLFYSGLPGAGKSYGAVEHLLIPGAREGRTIVTNLPLVPEFTAEFGVPVVGVPADVVEGREPEWWLSIPPGALVVLDEAWRFFPAGISANKLPESVREALTMHRHRVDEQGRSQQWVLISQNPTQCSKFVRDLVEQHFRITKLAAVGASKKFRVDIFEGVELDADKRIRQIFGEYSPGIWRWYRSHTGAVGSLGQVDESAIDRRGNVWASGWVRFGFPAAAALLLWGVYSVVGFFGSAVQGGGTVEAASAAGNVPASPGARVSEVRGPVVLPSQVALLSKDWRIAAELRSEDQKQWAIYAVDQRQVVRRLPPKDCLRVEGSVECVVDGERVTVFSGSGRPSVGEALVGGLAK